MLGLAVKHMNKMVNYVFLIKQLGEFHKVRSDAARKKLSSLMKLVKQHYEERSDVAGQ